MLTNHVSIQSPLSGNHAPSIERKLVVLLCKITCQAHSPLHL